MSRRRIAIAVATSLVAAGIVPLTLGLANAEPACPSWTDASGDATDVGGDPAGATADGDLDIVAATLTLQPTTITATWQIKALSATGPKVGKSDKFSMSFTGGGATLTTAVIRDFTNPLGVTVGADVRTTSANGIAQKPFVDVAKGIVSAEIKKSDIATLLGKPLVGLSFNAFTASAGIVVTTQATGVAASANPASGETAPAPAAVTIPDLGADSCASPAAPAPTGTASPAPSATPSATASSTPSGTPSPTPTGTPGAFEEAPYPFPRAGCQLITDAAGDGTAVVAGPAFGNDNDLDVSSVAVKTTATQIQVLAKIATLGDKPANPQNGDRFEVTFKLGGKTFAFGAGRQDQVATGASAPSANRNSVNGTTDTKLKLTPTFDKTKSTVILAIDRAALETAAGVPAPVGTALTAFAVKTYGYFGNKENAADTAQATAAADQLYTVGDNLCFFPPAAKMEWLGEDTVTAQYGDLVEAAVALSADDDTPLDGRAVTFTLGTATVTGTTDADGVADVFLPALVAAGAATVTPTVTAAFAGDADNYKTAFGYPVTVRSEATKLTLAVTKAGTARTVTATLVDDDQPKANAIAGQTLTVLVNGKKVGTVKTDAKGKAVWKTAKIGQTVKFTFAAVAGKYSTTSAQQKLA